MLTVAAQARGMDPMQRHVLAARAAHLKALETPRMDGDWKFMPLRKWVHRTSLSLSVLKLVNIGCLELC